MTKKNIELTVPNTSQVVVYAKNAKVFDSVKAVSPHEELWFKSNGQLFSYPPEIIRPGQQLSAHIMLDDNFWMARVNSVLSGWVKALENLQEYHSQNKIINYGIVGTDLTSLEKELAYKIKNFLDQTQYVPKEQKNYYIQKISLLNIDMSQAPVTGEELAPELYNLVIPDFTIEYFFYDKQGARINYDGTPYCNGESKILNFSPCGGKAAVGSYKTELLQIPKNCYELKFDLRISNSINNAIVAWTNNSKVKFPSTYRVLVKSVIDAFNDAFMESLSQVNSDIKKLTINPFDKTVNLDNDQKFVNKGLINADVILQRFNLNSNDNEQKMWILHWLWLTGGIPKMNPFNDQLVLFTTQSSNKVSPQDKALYEIFDKMVAKGSLKISDLEQLDTNFKNIPRIKAALDAESNQQTNEPQLRDRLLYQGLMKPAQEKGNIYMRHLDALNNYIIMGVHPVKEITENDRMYILIENKSVVSKLSISFDVVPIASETGQLANVISLSPADEFTENSGGVSPKKNKENASYLARLKDRTDSIYYLTVSARQLYDTVTALRSLLQAPVLPLNYESDTTPDFITYNLAHDYLYDAPAFANYSIKQGNSDNTEKEVAKGTYRIKKLYRFRLKAGLVYSFFKKTDFTEVSANHYTVDDSRSGIDGTFGIQTFFMPQDIRSDKIKFRGFLYTGLSMKKISENFYVGVGSEFYSGLTIGINLHIGKRETLVGNNNVPSGIKETWGCSLAPSIMVDPSLFVRLLTFNNSNKSLIGF